VGIEVPNDVREEVRLRGLLASAREEHAKMAVPLFLGRDASGRPLIEDLARMPHLMIAGSTGSGKSVCINTIILSILYTRSPAEVKLILVDPKMVELSYFAEIPHLLCPVVTDMRKAPTILEWAVIQMEKRYELFTRAAVRNIASYNNLGEDGLKSRMGEDCFDEGFEPPALTLPYIVIVVDELADLMMVAAKEVENSITRLAQKSRAVGIHIILATQRPSTNVITGLIKANLPTRISFQVASKIDSRVVIDRNGAENLLGSGDMLYLPPRSSKVMRAQGAFVADDEVRSTVKFLRDNTSPEFHRELVQERGAAAQDEEPPWERDVLYVEAARTILESQRGSASLLQRKYGIGYTRASRLIDMMAEQGLVGEYKGSQAREVLLSLEEFDEQIAELETD
ncbi:MAG: FtsK/SpoIIIE domain-containing protein, partial [Planctomycetota bacterium]